MNRKWISLVLVLITALTLSLSIRTEKARSADDLESKLNIYLQVLDSVKNDYIDKNVDNSKLMYGSIRGLLESLGDPYTRFLEPTSYKEMKIRLSGSYSGIGIYIGMKDKQIMVISPIKDTPAWKAGLKSKDKIMTIDGKPTKDMALDEAVGYIRGPNGSIVKLGILRGSAKETKEFKVSREKIVIKSVESEMLKDNIAYIKLNTFENQNASEEMIKALNLYKSKKANALILDLRNNGGGLLQNAIEIGGMFIKDGVIVYTIDRDGKKETISSSGERIWDKPTVVLINESSASASEILAGALHDNKVAVLVGTRSFGKALIQNVKQLEDGSAILVTIAKYLTPNGTDISKKGVEPNYFVEISTAEAESLAEKEVGPNEDDPQLKKAEEVAKGLISGNIVKDLKKARKVSATSL